MPYGFPSSSPIPLSLGGGAGLGRGGGGGAGESESSSDTAPIVYMAGPSSSSKVIPPAPGAAAAGLAGAGDFPGAAAPTTMTALHFAQRAFFPAAAAATFI